MQAGASVTLSKGASIILLDWRLMGGVVCDQTSGSHSHVGYLLYCQWMGGGLLILFKVVQDSMSADQILCKSLNCGIFWDPVDWRDKPIPRISVNSSQDGFMLLAEWKEFRVVSLSPISWLVLLKVMPYQDLALFSIAGRWGIWH